MDADGLAIASNGDDQFWLSLGVNLPLDQTRRDAAELEALSGAAEAAARLDDRAGDLAFRVRDGIARVEAQAGAARLFRDRILPEARQAVASAESSYRTGRLDFLALIDNTRRLIELELMYELTLTQLQQDRADLRSALGRVDDSPASKDRTHD